MSGYDHLQLGIDVTGADESTDALTRLHEAMKKAGEVTVWTGAQAAAGLGAMAHGFSEVNRESASFIAAHPLVIAGLGKIGYEVTQHVSTVEGATNAYRALRLAMSPTAFTGATLGAGLAMEELLRNAEKVAAATRKIAIEAAGSGMSFQQTLAMRTAGRIEGGDFSTVFAGKGTVEIAALAEQYKKLTDPVDKAAFAVDHFGANAERAMAMLPRGVQSSVSAANEFAASVTKFDRESLERLSTQMSWYGDMAHKVATGFREWYETEPLGRRWWAMIAAHENDKLMGTLAGQAGGVATVLAQGGVRAPGTMPSFINLVKAKADAEQWNRQIMMMQPVESGVLSRSDAAMAAYGASQAGLQGKLSEAEATRLKLRDQLYESRGTDLEATIRQRILGNEQEIASSKASIAAIEAKSQAVKDLEAAQKSLATFVEQMSQKEMGPVSRMLEQGREWIRQNPAATFAMGQNAMSAARVVAGGELQKMTVEDTKQSFEVAQRAGKLSAENWNEVYKTLDHVSSNTAKEFEEWTKAAAQVADELDRIKTGEARSEIMAQSGRTLNLANIRMGPGQEGQAITFAYQERIRLANQLYNFEQDHAHTLVEQEHSEADWRKGIFDAEIEHELKIAELQRKRLDERRAMGAQLFDAALGGSAGLQQFGLNFIKEQGRIIAGNVFADLTKDISGHFGSNNKYLQGSIFGMDPLKVATGLNTMATDLNTKALDDLAALLAAARTKALSGGDFSPAVSTFSRLTAELAAKQSSPLPNAAAGILSPFLNLLQGLKRSPAPGEQIGLGKIDAVGMPRDSSGLVLRGAGQASSDGGLGGAALKSATGLNTTATDLNTKALDDLTAALAAARANALSESGGGGFSSAGGGFSSAVGTYARIMAGAGFTAASSANWGSGLEVPGSGDSTAGLTQLPSGLWQRGPVGSDAASGAGVAEPNYVPADLIQGGVGFPKNDPNAWMRGGGMTLGKGVGYAAAGTAAAFGAYSGFKAGGAQGDLMGASSILGGASMIPGPQQPFIMAAALVTGLIGSLLGDPKKNRANEIDTWLLQHQFHMPDPVSIERDTRGRDVSYDMRGNLRPIQQTTNHYDNSTHVGTLSSIDSQDVNRFFVKNAAAVNKGIARAIDEGGEMVPKLASAMGLQ